MNAPTGDTIRAALAAAMYDEPADYLDGPRVNALVPVVQRLIAQAVTTALNDAADAELGFPAYVRRRLLARASAYTAEATR